MAEQKTRKAATNMLYDWNQTQGHLGHPADASTHHRAIIHLYHVPQHLSKKKERGTGNKAISPSSCLNSHFNMFFPRTFHRFISISFFHLMVPPHGYPYIPHSTRIIVNTTAFSRFHIAYFSQFRDNSWLPWNPNWKISCSQHHPGVNSICVAFASAGRTSGSGSVELRNGFPAIKPPWTSTMLP